MITTTPKAEYATPADVAAELRRMAGDLYPRTPAPEWAATVAQLIVCAQRIENIKAPS